MESVTNSEKPPQRLDNYFLEYALGNTEIHGDCTERHREKTEILCSLHEMVRQFVKREGISINQFVTLALAEKVPALATESYLEERAKRGNKQKFSPSFARGR